MEGEVKFLHVESRGSPWHILLDLPHDFAKLGFLLTTAVIEGKSGLWTMLFFKLFHPVVMVVVALHLNSQQAFILWRLHIPDILHRESK